MELLVSFLLLIESDGIASGVLCKIDKRYVI